MFDLIKIKLLKFFGKKGSGIIKIGKYSIEYTDFLSFYWEYIDIFVNKIYWFKTTKKHPIIIDAGGCIGTQIFYFKQLYPDSKIIVFEPDEAIFKVLKRNVNQNRLQNITLINKGLGKKNGVTKFYSDGSDGGSFFADGKSNEVTVITTKLSGYLGKKVDLLKMNIEGYEADVIEQIGSKILNINQIIFEYHNFSNLPANLGEILKIFEKNKFCYVVTEAESVKARSPGVFPNNYKFFNLVYAKKL